MNDPSKRDFQNELERKLHQPYGAVERTGSGLTSAAQTVYYNGAFPSVTQSPPQSKEHRKSVGKLDPSPRASVGASGNGKGGKKKNSLRKKDQASAPDSVSSVYAEILSELVPPVRVPKFGTHAFQVDKSLTSRCSICEKRVFAYINDVPVMSCSYCGFTTHADCWRKAFNAEKVVGTMNPREIPPYVGPYEVCPFNVIDPSFSSDQRITKSSILLVKQRVLLETSAYAKNAPDGPQTQFAISALGIFADLLEEIKVRDPSIGDLYQQFLKAVNNALKMFVEESNISVLKGSVNSDLFKSGGLSGGLEIPVSDGDLSPDVPWLDLFDVLDDILEDEEAYGNCKIPFSALPITDVAEEFCWIDDLKFKAIEWHELDNAVFTKKNKQEVSPNVMAFIDQFNRVTALIINDIQSNRNIQRRAKAVEYWISCADRSYDMRSFNSAKAIVSGLQATPIFRLKKTWACVNKISIQKMDQLIEQLTPDNNYQKYRLILKRIPEHLHVVPFLGVWLTDITYLSTALADNKPELRIKTDKILNEVYGYQCRMNHLMSIFGLRSYLMYTACMGDEEEQYKRSLFLEPRDGDATSGHSPNANRLTVTSPTGATRDNVSLTTLREARHSVDAGSLKRSSSFDAASQVVDALRNNLSTLSADNNQTGTRTGNARKDTKSTSPHTHTHTPRTDSGLTVVVGAAEGRSGAAPPPPRPPKQRPFTTYLPEALRDKKIPAGRVSSFNQEKNLLSPSRRREDDEDALHEEDDTESASVGDIKMEFLSKTDVAAIEAKKQRSTSGVHSTPPRNPPPRRPAKKRMQPSIPPHPPSSAVRNGSVPVPRPPKTKPPTAKNSSSIALTNIYGGTTSAEKVIPQLESALFAQRQLLEELYTPPAGGDSAVVPIEQPPLLSPAERICQEVIDKLQKLLAEVKEDARS